MKPPAAVARIFDGLDRHYPDADTELAHRNAFELLAATMLSAQSTDARVNLVTPALFARFPDAKAMAGADAAELETLIHATGFFRQKAKSLIGMATILVTEHEGQVPPSMDALVALPGVGRKTANVVLNIAFGEPTIAVDTHLFRIGNRTGIAPGKDVAAVEAKLMKLVPAEFRQHAHHWLILHGRYVCKARAPDCPACLISDLCEYKHKTVSGER